MVKLRRCVIVGLAVILSSVCLQAVTIPKFLKQIPQELHGEYQLVSRLNFDKTHQEFTNPVPFATISSKSVVLANGQRRMLESGILVSEKGTNAYVISFKDKSSWLITSNSPPPGLAIIEPKAPGSKEGTIFVVEPKREKKR